MVFFFFFFFTHLTNFNNKSVNYNNNKDKYFSNLNSFKLRISQPQKRLHFANLELECLIEYLLV